MADKFSERLQRLRKKKGINQQVLSELCGLSKNVVARYERGEIYPSFRALMELADYFDVPLDYLCGRTD